MRSVIRWERSCSRVFRSERRFRRSDSSSETPGRGSVDDAAAAAANLPFGGTGGRLRFWGLLDIAAAGTLDLAGLIFWGGLELLLGTDVTAGARDAATDARGTVAATAGAVETARGLTAVVVM